MLEPHSITYSAMRLLVHTRKALPDPVQMWALNFIRPLYQQDWHQNVQIVLAQQAVACGPATGRKSDYTTTMSLDNEVGGSECEPANI